MKEKTKKIQETEGRKKQSNMLVWPEKKYKTRKCGTNKETNNGEIERALKKATER